MAARDEEPFVAYLAQHGLRPEDVADTDRMRDVGDLAALRSVLQLILGYREHDLTGEQIRRLRPWMLPSRRLDDLLRHHQIAQGDSPKGSDLLDASIAPMALYTDVTFVDKRTQEFLGRIRRAHPDLNDALGLTLRWSTPAAALAALQGT